jgi:hypothetical protein
VNHVRTKEAEGEKGVEWAVGVNGVEVEMVEEEASGHFAVESTEGGATVAAGLATMEVTSVVLPEEA